MDLRTATQKLEKLDPEGCQLLRRKHDHGLRWEEIAEVTGRSVWQVRNDYAACFALVAGGDRLGISDEG